jgi:predicted lactoylglutathione lyase
MATKVFVNLPVKSLNKAAGFFTKLGFQFNPQFTDETASCMWPRPSSSPHSQRHL